MVSRAAATKATPKSGSARKDKDDVQVITLRIGKRHKATLLAHCHQLGKQRGKQVSFNSAIIEMIEGLR